MNPLWIAKYTFPLLSFTQHRNLQHGSESTRFPVVAEPFACDGDWGESDYLSQLQTMSYIEKDKFIDESGPDWDDAVTKQDFFAMDDLIEKAFRHGLEHQGRLWRSIRNFIYSNGRTPDEKEVE